MGVFLGGGIMERWKRRARIEGKVVMVSVQMICLGAMNSLVRMSFYISALVEVDLVPPRAPI